MEISILAVIFKIIYLVIFMFIFIKPFGVSIFKLINMKKSIVIMKKFFFKNILRAIHKFFIIFKKEYYFNLYKYIIDVFRFI